MKISFPVPAHHQDTIPIVKYATYTVYAVVVPIGMKI